MKMKKNKSLPDKDAFAVADSFTGSEWREGRARLYHEAVACYNDIDGTTKARINKTASPMMQGCVRRVG